MNPALTFARAHWRPLATTVLVLVAYGAGRFAGPTKVIDRTVVDTKTQAALTESQRKVESLTLELARTQNQLIDLQTKRVTVAHSVKRPDGTVTTDTTTRVDTAQQTATQTKTDEKKTDTVASTDTKAETTTTTAHTETTHEVIRDAPRVTVAAMAAVTSAGHVLYGGEVLYRVIGPVQVGAFVLGGPEVVGGVAVGFTF